MSISRALDLGVVVLGVVLLGVVFALAASSADAQTPAKSDNFPPAAPQANGFGDAAKAQTQDFGDWRLRCQTTGAAPQTRRSCEILQAVMSKSQATPFAQIAFGKPSPSEPLLVTVVVPPDVVFPSEVRIAADEKDAHPAILGWRRCVAAGCFANLGPKPDLLKRWRGLQSAGRVSFKNGAGQEVVMPISFRGLADALDALDKQR